PGPPKRWVWSCVAFMLLVDMLCLTHKISDKLEREGADHALSTRVSPTTFERFQVIVGQMAVERPDITPSAHLREIIEAYCEQGIVPAPTVSISDPKQARDTIVNAVTDLLRDLGYTGL
ncbi:hypothetical protein ACUXAV_006585, partial [Cupriavidus metallidurans]